jgi:hypothetical protein
LLDFSDLLTEAATGALGLHGPERDAFVQSRSQSMWNALQSEQETRTRDGVAPVLHLIDDVKKCRWYSNGQSTTNRERYRRLRLASRPAFLSHIDDLTWREYEALGCETALLCGATHVELTPPGNECGIDFFAVLKLHGNNHVFTGKGTPLRVIGQSKKYESRVEVDRVKSFNEALVDVQKKEPKVTALTPAWFQAHRGPIAGWMVAHRGFQSGAKTRAHNHGILVSDTVDLAEIASLSRALELGQPDERAQQLIGRVEARLA